ncbi:MAG: phenylacetate--CoA ligase family protein [Rhodospirillaceae bacterium]|nr:phenylacetate--CoA ligase family protein [Rhodospirillaceae bacterium]
MARLQAYYETPLDRILQRSRLVDPGQAAIELFHDVAVTVPAYGAFLAEHGVDPAAVRTPADFARLPLTTKENYVLRHPLPALCRHGRLEDCDMIAVSSGSTGTPTSWPRAVVDELAIATRFEQVFLDSFAADERRTLAVVCFALGTWVGGLYTTDCCRHLAAKGHPVTVVAPGSNKAEIYRVLKALAGTFDQTVLLGYPPFLKDVIDGGPAAGIDWAALRTRLVLAGEVFSEDWRSLVGARIGADDVRYAFASLYGTADAGVLAVETPLSIEIRRFLAARPEAARQIFGEPRLPTLAQYDPLARYFETVDGTLLFTGDNGAPLVRYHIADSGGLLDYHAMLQALADFGFDPLAGLADEGWRGVRELPFVWVFGRSGFAVSYFGANVYPENVAPALERPGIAEWLTGKFVLEAREGLEAAPHLAVAVELAPGLTGEEPETPARAEALADAILAELLRVNSEFGAYTPPEFRRPRVTLLPAGHPDYFPPGVKHRYSRR